MDAATRSELRSLRHRAYGPAADIAGDPAAMRRLSELETLARGAADAALPAVDPRAAASILEQPDQRAQPAAPARLERPDHLPHAGKPEQSAQPEHATQPQRRPRRPRGQRRRTRLWWSLSLVAAAGLGAAVTYGAVAVTPVAASSGARQIDSLRPSPTVQVPSGWFGAGPSSATYEFHGLTLFETANGMYGGSGDCFAIVASQEVPTEPVDSGSWSLNGVAYTACRVGDFPAAVAIPVDSSAPPELRERFDDGALQFVKRGEVIGVFRDGD
jgi:hypothetical protein